MGGVQAGIVHDIMLQELRIQTDYGRCCRPLFLVHDHSLKVKKGDIRRLTTPESEDPYSWQDLIDAGMLECALLTLFLPTMPHALSQRTPPPPPLLLTATCPLLSLLVVFEQTMIWSGCHACAPFVSGSTLLMSHLVI